MTTLKKIGIASAALLVVVGVAAITLPKMQYIDPKAKELAVSFVQSAMAQDYAKAYALTSQQSEVGVTQAEFIALLESQFSDVPKAFEMTVLNVSNFQSWGHYLKQRSQGITCNPNPMSFLIKLEAEPSDAMENKTESYGARVFVAPTEQCEWQVLSFERSKF
uniref:hypothetical protein n=1 Tax=Thaumasiovibrio occultus TaxID=1891184 RepID=UPI000B3615AA|nr:hypothetical protein [Thaumasiovibrio occultus]